MRPRAGFLIAMAALTASVASTAMAQRRVWTNTEHVFDLAAHRGALFVATGGGVERYSLAGGARERLYTTEDGLAHPTVRALEVRGDTLVAMTRSARCELAAERFQCVPHERRGAEEEEEVERSRNRQAPARIAVARRLRGHRVSIEREVAGVRFVGTAGGGVFRVARSAATRLTPRGQVCSNHITDAVHFRGRVVLGSFGEGLCERRGARFRRIEAPFRMVNALAETPRGLYAAAVEGLFLARDGRHFRRVHARAIARANGLAFDGRSLWVSQPAALHRLRIAQRGPATRTWWRPGGSVAVQDVALGAEGVWLVSEDRGALHFRPGSGEHDETVERFDRLAGLPSSWTFSVDTLPDGTAFVGTLRHGLVAIAADGRHREVALPGTEPAWLLRVRRMDDSRLLVGTQDGAFLLEANGHAQAIEGVPDPRVHEAVVLDGTLWIGTEAGLLEVPRWEA